MQILEITPPEILKQIPSCPQKLFAIGNIDLLNEKYLVAIVGSRRASDYGLKNARSISKKLAQSGVVIVSGLALGIDASAHRGALEANGKTIAVLGSAIDQFEPRTNEQLAREIIKSGGLIISEYPKGSTTFATNFALRNRIVAGLSIATIVIEAQEKSGALITANLAADFNRQVYALPGDVDRLNSKGTNKLISSGAICLSDPSIILEDLGIEGEDGQLKLELNTDETRIISSISSSSKSFDKIISEVELSPSQVMVLLTSLELKSVVSKNSDGEYFLTSAIDLQE